MAGVKLTINTVQIATGTSAKTLLQVVAASNHRVRIKEWSIAFEGVSNTAAPIQVRVLKQTTAGTMSALTPVKWNDNDDETLQTTAQHTSTSEPTASDVKQIELVHPQSGYTWQPPSSEEDLIIPGGQRMGWEVTAAADVDAVVRVIAEE